MRLLGEIESSDHTTRLVAWLMTKGIKVKVEPTGGENESYEVWVRDEDLLDQAKTELGGFLANPQADKYNEAIKAADAIAREEALQRKRMQKNIVKVQGGQVKKKNPLTVLLIVLCGLVALMTNIGEAPPDNEVLKALQFVSVAPPLSQELATKALGNKDSLILRLASIQRGEFWRLVTPIFIHYGITHILFNLYMWFQFGRIVENRYGTLYLGLLVLSVAVISNFAQCVVPEFVGGHGPSLIPSGQLITRLGGMSGVVYGVFGFIWMRSKVDPSSGMFMSQGTVTILIVWLFFCMTPFSEQVVGNVANWAHGVGLLVGMAAGYWPAIKK